MRPFPAFTQFILGSLDHHFMAEINELGNELFDVEYFRTAFDKRHVIDAVGCLKIGMLIQLVYDHLCHGILFQFHHDSRAFLIVAFVIDIADAFDDFFIDQVADLCVSESLFTWYGTSVMTIFSRPLLSVSTVVFPRSTTRPRPVSSAAFTPSYP